MKTFYGYRFTSHFQVVLFQGSCGETLLKRCLQVFRTVATLLPGRPESLQGSETRDSSCSYAWHHWSTASGTPKKMPSNFKDLKTLARKVLLQTLAEAKQKSCNKKQDRWHWCTVNQQPLLLTERWSVRGKEYV